jgi:hypothetical protein
MAAQAGSSQSPTPVRDDGLSDLRALGRMLMGAPPSPDLNWKALLALSRGYGLSPLLYFRLFGPRGSGEAGDAGPCVPQGAAELLRLDYHAMVARWMAAGHQLAGILHALAAAHVPGIVLKGPVVADFYPLPALRAYGDLDLLVPKAQLAVAERALNHLGYACTRPKTRAPEAHRHLPPMVSDHHRLAVELHTRLDDSGRVGRLPVRDLWARAVPWSVNDQQALRLEEVDAVLYLCRHAAVQHWGRWYLRSVVDLAQMTGGWGRGEWDALTRRAAACELDRAVVLMLVLAEQVLGVAAPPETMAALYPAGLEPLPEDLAERSLQMDGEPAATAAVVARAGLAEPLLPRVRRLWGIAFQRRESMAAKYKVPAGSPRVWLTYLWRPVDLLQRYVPVLWHTLRREPAANAAWSQTAWLQLWLQGDAE